MSDSAAAFATAAKKDETESDGALVARARQGDAASFEQLVRRHQRPTRALAYAIVGDWAEAEDLTQEAFLRVFRNLDLLADAEKFAPWLRRVTFGVCIDWVRTFRPQLYRYTNGAAEAATMAAPSGEASPLDRVERLELSERVMRALGELPPRYRTPLTLYHIDGLSHEKVARTLDIPVGTVRSLVARATQARRRAASRRRRSIDSTRHGGGSLVRAAGRPAYAARSQRGCDAREDGAVGHPRHVHCLGRRAARGSGARWSE